MAYTTSRSRILAAAYLPFDRNDYPADGRDDRFPPLSGPGRGPLGQWTLRAATDPVRGVRLACALAPVTYSPRTSPLGGLHPELLVCGASAHLGHGPAVHLAIRLRSGHARGLSPDRERDLRTAEHRRGWLATPYTAPATKGTTPLTVGETRAAI